MKGTLHADGGRHTLRFERQLAHPPEKVWRALTDNAELAHWFPAEIHGAREPGARLRFTFTGDPSPEKEQYEATADTTMVGEIVVHDPPRTLEFTWGDERLRFELHRTEAGTRLVFTHTFDDESKAARDASGWDVCFAALEHRLDGREPEAATPERYRSLFAEYAQRFGPRASGQGVPSAEG